jgi:hypothetical protein
MLKTESKIKITMPEVMSSKRKASDLTVKNIVSRNFRLENDGNESKISGTIDFWILLKLEMAMSTQEI